jgi:hypothetical protein
LLDRLFSLFKTQNFQQIARKHQKIQGLKLEIFREKIGLKYNSSKLFKDRNRYH